MSDRFISGNEADADAALLARAWETRCRHHPPRIRFDRPLRTLPVSVTGRACALNCAHCGGRYLGHMRTLDDAVSEDVNSLLISGGCDADGRVPVAAHLDEIARRRPGHRLNWHVGLIDEDTARRIAPLVDVVSFDVVGDGATAREVYGLERDLDDYMVTFDMLRRHVRVVPHITIGLRGGAFSGERRALAALAARDVDEAVFLVLIPTEGTAFADRRPPEPEAVARYLAEARTALPAAWLSLGCMRPHGTYRQVMDVLAVRAGVNGIVNPVRAAEGEALARGLEIEWGEECCTLR